MAIKKYAAGFVMITLSAIAGFNVSGYRVTGSPEIGCHPVYSSMVIRFQENCLSEKSAGYFEFPRSHVSNCSIPNHNSVQESIQSSIQPVSLSIPIALFFPEENTNSLLNVDILARSQKDGGCYYNKILNDRFSYSIVYGEGGARYDGENKEELKRLLRLYLESHYVTIPDKER